MCPQWKLIHESPTHLYPFRGEQFILFRRVVQSVEKRLFTDKTGFYSSLDLFVDALSSPVLIVATGVSHISDLTCYVEAPIC
jgi:hypothetical protein